MSRLKRYNGIVTNEYHRKLSLPKRLVCFGSLLVSLLIVDPILERAAECVEIGTVTVVAESDTLKISSDLKLDESHISELKDGLKKEFIFYVDLFRQWTIWPNEFIHGVRIIRKISSDPVKKEFTVINSVGTSLSEQRFNSLDSLLLEALRLDGIELTKKEKLVPGSYFVKVTAESRIRKHAPIIGYILFFVPENEFEVEKISDTFIIPEK